MAAVGVAYALREALLKEGWGGVSRSGGGGGALRWPPVFFFYVSRLFFKKKEAGGALLRKEAEEARCDRRLRAPRSVSACLKTCAARAHEEAGEARRRALKAP